MFVARNRTMRFMADLCATVAGAILAQAPKYERGNGGAPAQRKGAVTALCG